MALESDSISCESSIFAECSDSDDLASIQRRRRMRRVQILKEKRRQFRSYNSMRSGPTLSSTCDLTKISDPKLLRKLRNRESAARSRQKKDDMVDDLTYRLCEYYVILTDLQAEQCRLLDVLYDARGATTLLHPASTDAPSFPFPSDVVTYDDQDCISVSDLSSCLSGTASPPHIPADESFGFIRSASLPIAAFDADMLSDFACNFICT